jgi:hypothetical protein
MKALEDELARFRGSAKPEPGAELKVPSQEISKCL